MPAVNDTFSKMLSRLELSETFLTRSKTKPKVRGVSDKREGQRTWSEVIPNVRSFSVSIHIFYPFSYIIKLCFEARG